VVKKVLVKVEETLWARMRARALEAHKPVSDVVAWAFRQYLTPTTDGKELTRGDDRD